jgi:hypothetical protein
VINISRVLHFYDPDREPEPGKDFCVVLVPCEKHVKAEDIDDDHCFIRDVSYMTSEGEEFFKKGSRTRLLSSYIESRKKCTDLSMWKNIFVWGQPRALDGQSWNFFNIDACIDGCFNCVIT